MSTLPTPVYAAFASLADALDQRAQHGGWIFQPTNDSKEPVLWFSPGFTPSRVMTHRATRGMSGLLL